MNAAKHALFESVRDVVIGRLRDEVQVREIAMRVSEESTALRRRLDRAVGYARAGLRLEACAEAEAEPSVFELASAFEADHMRQWRSMCQKNRLPVQEDISAESIAEVEEAIALAAPLKSRLARMRRLVLSDAGAWDRLEVLRELISRDPDNPAWQDDRAALEPVAVQDVVTRAEAALKSGILEEAETWVARMNDDRWSSSGAARAAGPLRARLDAAHVDRAVINARQVISRMEAEWQAENVDAVRAELLNYQEQAQQAAAHGGHLPMDLEDRASQCSGWLEDRDAAAAAFREHQDRAADLDRLVQSEASTLRELRAALRAGEQTSEGVPEQLRAAAIRRIEQLERRERLRRNALIASVAVLVAAVAVSAAFVLRAQDRSRRADEAAGMVTRTIEEGEFDKAGQQLKDLRNDAEIGTSEQLAQAEQLLQSRIAEVRDRRSRFRTLMAEAGNPLALSAKPDLVEQAKDLVQGPDEQQEVAGWVSSHKKAVEDRRTARAQEGLAKVKAVADGIAVEHPAADPAWEGRIAGWDLALSDLQRQFGEHDRVVEEIGSARVLLDARRRMLLGTRTEQDRIGRIEGLGQKSGTPSELAEALRAILADFGDSPDSNDIKRALEAAPTWEAIVDWGSNASRPTVGLATDTPEKRELAIKAAEAHADRYRENSPYLTGCREVEPLLGRASNWRNWIERSMASREDFKLFMVRDRAGARWYCRKDPTADAAQVQNGVQSKVILAIQNLAMQEVFVTFEVASLSYQGPSPQRILVKDLLAFIDNEDLLANDISGAFAVLDTVVGNKDLDGALKAWIVQSLLETMAPDMPTCVSSDMSKAAKSISREKAQFIDWPNAQDLSARKSSLAVDGVVRASVQVDLWRKAYRDALAKACRTLEPVYAPAGVFLRRDGKPAFRSSGGTMPPTGTVLFVAEPPLGAKPAVLIRVAEVTRSGEIQFEPLAASVPTGSMVFKLSTGGVP